MAVIIDCTAPAKLDYFKGDYARCALVSACQRRFFTQGGIPVPPDIMDACEKVLAAWDASEKERALAITKPNDDAIRALMNEK